MQARSAAQCSAARRFLLLPLHLSAPRPACWRQVAVDVPRTAPNVPFFQQPAIQKSLERMLYIWGIR